ncbi:hypothetical protein CYMTET_28047 [Cymbomonas tetramitiformis]|uniref:Uncharacterized protein n=1 Tax=Cymbomonas tetramitiformis TaxID=36881 RepID=A0AAE0KWB2_9CHLO|nr:hypothetical protein CYMTET_28047 [Cymbomonas tetramitiformis]
MAEACGLTAKAPSAKSSSVWGPPLSVVGTDSGSEDEFPVSDPVTDLPAAPTTAPRIARLATSLLPLMAFLGCATAAHGSVVQCTTAAVLPAVHPPWVTANLCFVSPELSPPALPPDPQQSFAFPPPLPFTDASPPDHLFWTPGFWPGFWLLASGLWFSGSGSGLWFWLNTFDNPDYFDNNNSELCFSVDHFRSG